MKCELELVSIKTNNEENKQVLKKLNDENYNTNLKSFARGGCSNYQIFSQFCNNFVL